MKSIGQKRLLFVVALMASLASSAGADVGMGVSFKSNDSSIYLPWQINDNWRLEGEVRKLSQEGATPLNSFGVFPGITSSGGSDSDIWELGAGLFWTKPLESNLSFLLGLRLNYISVDGSSVSASSTTTVRTRSEGDGYEWAPTAALEYSLTDKVKIAAEVNYFFQDLDQETQTTIISTISGTTVNTTNLDSEVSGTNTRLILRYFF